MTYKRKNIESVMIIDDQADVRESIAEQVEDAEFKAIIESEPIISLDSCIKKIQDTANAAIFDCHLSQRNYANFHGIDGVKKLYKLAIPIIVATSFINADKLEIQAYKQYVPVIVNPNEITPELIIKGFELCQNEFSGIFSPERKPWRSLIRVEEISEDEKFIYVVVPSWSISEKIRLPISSFPIQNEKILGMRFFTNVNIGAEKYDDIYFDHSQFEVAKKPTGRYAEFLRS